MLQLTQVIRCILIIDTWPAWCPSYRLMVLILDKWVIAQRLKPQKKQSLCSVHVKHSLPTFITLHFLSSCITVTGEYYIPSINNNNCLFLLFIFTDISEGVINRSSLGGMRMLNVELRELRRSVLLSEEKVGRSGCIIDCTSSDGPIYIIMHVSDGSRNSYHKTRERRLVPTCTN